MDWREVDAEIFEDLDRKLAAGVISEFELRELGRIVKEMERGEIRAPFDASQKRRRFWKKVSQSVL
jgi:hypothetical protein